jgi:hypothetical protein
MVVDAFVETSVDEGEPWIRASDQRPDFTWFDGPWSVPEAVEVGRGLWAMFLRASRFHNLRPTVRVRVIDTAGVIAEQWPKPEHVAITSDHPGYLLSGVMATP